MFCIHLSLFLTFEQRSPRIMVNIFVDHGKGSRGLRRIPGPIGPTGARGPKGRKGDGGSSGIDDMCRWMPKLVLEQFQQDEACCFTLANPQKDLQVGTGGGYCNIVLYCGVCFC